jgi:hypothetical protein
MMSRARVATQRASMRIDARPPEGHVLVCSGADSEHSFLVHRLGLSVECPHCGRTAVSVHLVADFYQRGLDALAVSVPDQRLETRDGQAGTRTPPPS